MSNKEFQSAIREVLKRSAADPTFRQLALSNPQAAIAKVGQQIPAGTTVRFVDNHGKSDKVYVLPDPVAAADSLTEEELERVAGGDCQGTCDASCIKTSLLL